MGKRNSVIVEVKKQYVRMALEAGNRSFVARKLGISPKTLCSWVQEYRDEVEREMAQEGVTPLTNASTTNDIQAKYEKAMKLLGEKELEVALLREQLKKNFPGSMNK